jgi:aminopeptidase N
MLPAFRGDLTAFDQATRYEIDLTVDPKNARVVGHQRVLYTNTEDVPLNDVYFRLFPNTSGYGGSATVDSLLVNGQPASVTAELENSALRATLPEPLLPGEQVDFVLDFRVSLPTSTNGGYGQLAYRDGVVALANVYPMIPVYDDEAWNVELAKPYGDATYTDTALYRVRCTAPAEMAIAASGSQVDWTDNGDGTATWTFVSGPMRDFNVIMSSDFQVISTTVGDVIVNSYVLPNDAAGGQRALDYASDALRVYDARFGTYPFTDFDVVEVPLSGAGGIEYPGLVVVDGGLYGQERGFFEHATVHETAHQWWYSTVGNDQVDEPWLDEALTNYSVVVYLEEVYGQEEAEAFVQGYFVRNYQEIVAAGRDEVVGRPVAEFSEEQYGPIVYVKGPLFFHYLRQQVGDEAFFAILRAYFQRYRYGIATPEGFLTVATQVSGQDITPLYEKWILSAER